MKKGKKKISSIKQKNLKHTKLSKQGKLRSKRNKKKSLIPKNKNTNSTEKPVSGDEESNHGEDMLQMIDKDDLNFLQNAIASDSYSLLRSVQQNTNIRKRKRGKDGEQNYVEKQYEEMAAAQIEPKRTKHLLPIKTKDGLIQRTVDEDLSEEKDDDDEALETKKPESVSKPEEVDSDMELMMDASTDVEGLNTDIPVSTAELLAVREEALRKRKLLIGVLASSLLEDPQLKGKNFKCLLDMMDEEMPELRITVCKLATVSLLEVFKDVIPSYQIKHQENPGVKLRKETLKLEGFERTLLNSYKTYLQKLENLVSVLDKKKGNYRPSQREVGLAELAVHCMCDLLMTHPYFNFSQNLVQMLVPYLNHKMSSVRDMCANCMRTLFKNDKKGEISLQIVRYINHLVKSRSHSVYSEVLNVLLSLRIKEVNLEKEKEDEMKQKKLMKHKQRLISMSKNERKRNKQLESLEKEMLETKAQENKETKQKYLTEITKLVFAIYFRVLKKAPSSKILSITLEGLARYAHCINLEFYQDIVNVLNQLLEEEHLGYREQLHCVQTVFTILSGQGEVLNIDPLRFYTHLYRNLFLIHAGSSHADALTVLQTLEKSLIQRRKKISQQRIYSFTKRLATLAMQLLHNGTLGCLAVIKTVMQLNRSVDILLDPDTSVGQGIYYPELEDPEYCNASSTAMWELVALERYYHPTVKKFARNILLGVPASGEGSIAPEIAKLKPEDLFSEFDPSEMIFKPAVPAPKKSIPKSKPPSHFYLKNDDLATYIQQITERQMKKSLDFSQNLFPANT